MSERLSNLDMNDKLVRRGLTVSFHGFRGRVLRVRTGKCLVSFAAVCKSPPAHGWPDQWLICGSVQVVSPLPGAGRKAAPPVSRVGAMGAALPL